MFADVCTQFVQIAATAEQVPMLVDQAFRTAVATRSPTCVVLPHDVQTSPAAQPLPHAHGVIATTPGYSRARIVPHDGDLRTAADVLRAGDRVAILVGQGAADAADLVIEVADRLGAGVAASLLGKPVLDERLAWHTGVMGHLGTTASSQLMAHCDTLLLVGTNDPWTEFYPAPGQARAIQIDIDGRRLGARYPIEVGLLGDAVETLSTLVRWLPHRADQSWRAQVQAWVRRWREIAAERATVAADPLNPQLVVRELSTHLPADVAVSVDVGSITYWYARHLRLPAGAPAHLSSTLASMGSALPYGIAAKLAYPDRPVVALAGDGSMQMNGLAELITVADRWRSWPDPRFVILVLNNRDLAEVSWEQREVEGDPRFDPSQRLPDVPYAEWAKLLGLQGIRIDTADAVDRAWAQAFAADRPTLIEAVVDPDIPLLPPDRPYEKVRKMYAGLAQEGGSGARAREHLLRERATEGHDDVPPELARRSRGH